jgi:selenide, water dikinase
MTVALTSLSHGAGCGCKLPASEVHRIAAQLPVPDDANLLVGAGTADDAGVYRLTDELALVQTVDFFTPIVDDPFDFGRIAAANALSDVYAMGGRPVTALNLVAFPLESLGRDVLAEILRGGAAGAAEAGVAIVGGHSIDDPEPKYGLAVTGVVHPDRLLRNSTARPGDVIRLTKPVGGGVVSTAAKRGAAPAELLVRTVEVMTTLNREWAELAVAAGASAMTDVTGYGLLGHLCEMAAASGVEIELSAGVVPAIEGVAELLQADDPPVSGGTRRNREWVEPQVRWDGAVPEWQRWLLCDAMTSGGLLVAAPPDSGAPGIEIGRVTGTQSASRLRPPVFVRAARATASSSAADVRPAPTHANRKASPERM